jgi:hypothetical protein
MTTYFQGAIKQGATASEYLLTTSTTSALVTSVYKVTLQANSTANVDTTITLPARAQIISFNADSTVAWTATTASLTAGVTAGGTEYVAGFDVKTITRGPTAAFTATQLAAMANISTNTTLAIRVASTGANSVGTTLVTVTVALTE